MTKGTQETLKTIALLLATLVANWGAVTKQIDDRMDTAEERLTEENNATFDAIQVRQDSSDARELRHYHELKRAIANVVPSMPAAPRPVNRTIITPADTAGTQRILREMWRMQHRLDSMRAVTPWPFDPYRSVNDEPWKR